MCGDWIFDLDNTLYHADNGVFAQIDARMTDYVAGFCQAWIVTVRGRVQKQLYRDHGTTLAGLIAEHGSIPNAYLHYVHDMDLSEPAPRSGAGRGLARLPGRRFVFTNGCRNHAARILERLEMGHLFDADLGHPHHRISSPKPGRRRL